MFQVSPLICLMDKQLLGMRLGIREWIGGETWTEFTDVLTAWDQRYRHCSKWPSDPKILPTLPNSTWNHCWSRGLHQVSQYHASSCTLDLLVPNFENQNCQFKHVKSGIWTTANLKQPCCLLLTPSASCQTIIRQGARQSLEKMLGRTWIIQHKPRTPQDKENLT